MTVDAGLQGFARASLPADPPQYLWPRRPLPPTRAAGGAVWSPAGAGAPSPACLRPAAPQQRWVWRLQSTQSTACASPGPEAEKLWVYLLREAPLSAQLFCCQIQPGLVLCALCSPPGVTSCGTTQLPPRIGTPRAPAPRHCQGFVRGQQQHRNPLGAGLAAMLLRHRGHAAKIQGLNSRSRCSNELHTWTRRGSAE